jgi:AcrR family transcriptional regulator
MAGKPTPGLRERNRARTYAEIADAALDLFERQGYDATTVDQIASAAGVSPATFFRYFATKEDVLFADEEPSAAALTARVAARSDRRTTSVAALAEPVIAYAEATVGPDSPHSLRLMRLVMTTPSLAPRSLRMRLRWERDLANQLAEEDGLAAPELKHALAVLVREAFEHATG